MYDVMSGSPLTVSPAIKGGKECNAVQCITFSGTREICRVSLDSACLKRTCHQKNPHIGDCKKFQLFSLIGQISINGCAVGDFFILFVFLFFRLLTINSILQTRPKYIPTLSVGKRKPKNLNLGR